MEIKLQTSMEVNKHLNGEVEALTRQLDQLKEQNAAYERHIQELTDKLAQQKRGENHGADQVSDSSTKYG